MSTWSHNDAAADANGNQSIVSRCHSFINPVSNKSSAITYFPSGWKCCNERRFKHIKWNKWLHNDEMMMSCRERIIQSICIITRTYACNNLMLTCTERMNCLRRDLIRNRAISVLLLQKTCNRVTISILQSSLHFLKATRYK